MAPLLYIGLGSWIGSWIGISLIDTWKSGSCDTTKRRQCCVQRHCACLLFTVLHDPLVIVLLDNALKIGVFHATGRCETLFRIHLQNGLQETRRQESSVGRSIWRRGLLQGRHLKAWDAMRLRVQEAAQMRAPQGGVGRCSTGLPS